MEFSYFRGEYPWYSCPVNMGSTWQAMVDVILNYLLHGHPQQKCQAHFEYSALTLTQVMNIILFMFAQ